ncbi:YceI family protein [Uliginosibacterium gangwonense]|uniref:YceI family protein n=1 Tax=Uliginosibacterium gangwonense TaxID=392736 RepID=UPI0009FFFCAB|nr:YceI family protein [Uliginosibacterium gangwonense]
MFGNSRCEAKPRALKPWLFVGLSLGLLCQTGCQTLPEPVAIEHQAARTSRDEKALENADRYTILPELSDVRFLVFRGGPLAKLGHNHVVQAKSLRGEILLTPDVHQSRFTIEIPVKDFQVDTADARLDEGGEFLPQPDEEAIAGTTRNMLGEKVLDAAHYPIIEIRSGALTGPGWGMDVVVKIKMHGVECEIVVPTAVEYDHDKLIVTASFSIKQSDFGITPMSVLGGALQVEDTVKIRMRIVASKQSRDS